jgi:hypothetical protein
VSALAALQRDFMRVLAGESGALAPGLEVYRRGMRGNHAGALTATYPVVTRLVGEAFFDEAARAYAAAHPSSSGDLNQYGGHFAAFLAAYPHAASLPYLPDVARLEWACHECEQAPDAAPFDFAALAAVAPAAHGGLRFTLHPSVRLVASAHPIVSIHAANAPERDGTPQRTQGAEHALVHRVEGRARVQDCGQAGFELLQALARGARLGDTAAAPEALAGWVASGVISAFTAPPCAR